ncbi:GNAT family N-acetyltransferase [Desmospora profundinema]|uniref:RimJ/RimL family protein N-acetyltransferase n=1 Tax=Desmospora profundinema TaxID=1571184 RepID=A0ABU1ISJ5_9BACL|nr:GNAT family N-acetyltransferase [Desmospora profundinema]MDR6226735.1 RimJ/RimL family protein N-acetyltransferase [Desmospora profundinema]
MRQYRLDDGDPLIIREAEPADAERIVSYLRQVAGESDALALTEEEVTLDVEQQRDVITDYAEGDNRLFLVAEWEGRIVGVLTFEGGRRKRVAHSGEFGMSVLKAHWGRSIGSRLMDSLLDWAREGNVIRKINLRVKADNQRALALYRKYGFRREGRLIKEFCLDGTYVDLDLMSLWLEPDSPS